MLEVTVCDISVSGDMEHMVYDSGVITIILISRGGE